MTRGPPLGRVVKASSVNHVTLERRPAAVCCRLARITIGGLESVVDGVKTPGIEPAVVLQPIIARDVRSRDRRVG